MEKKNTKTITCKITIIDSIRFMANLLSDLVENLAERIHKIKC